MTARRPHGGVLDFAGWRLRPRFRLPKSWRLPSSSASARRRDFPRKIYEENSATLELRPIIEKTWGKVQLASGLVQAGFCVPSPLSLRISCNCLRASDSSQPFCSNSTAAKVSASARSRARSR